MEIIKQVKFGTLPYINKNKEEYVRSMYREQIEYKQFVSNYIFDHFDVFSSIILNNSSKHVQNDLYKLYSTQYLQAWSKQKLQQEVIDMYKNKLNKIKNKLKFNLYTVEFKRYKGKKRFGQVKSMRLHHKKSKLVNFLTYLSKVNFKNVEELKNSIKIIVFKHADFTPEYEFIDKYNLYDRIFNLLKSKKNRVFNKYFKQPIMIYKTKIPLAPTKNRILYDVENRLLQYFLMIKKGIYIPLTINENYNNHQHLDKINWNDISLNINKNKRIVIQSSMKLDQDIKISKEKNIQSIDVNVKHNIFVITVFSKTDNTILETREFNIDHDLLRNDVLDKLKEIDTKGYQNLSNSDRKLLNHVRSKFEFELKSLISQQIKWLQEMNVDEIVMEYLNLSQTTKGKRQLNKSELFYGFNLNRIVRILRLSNIKHWFKQQGENRNIQVHFVNPKYTSQKCPVCGNISKSNRQSQEIFKCTNCGYTQNQDFNATINIYLKYLENVSPKKQDKSLRISFIDKHRFVLLE